MRNSSLSWLAVILLILVGHPMIALFLAIMLIA